MDQSGYAVGAFLPRLLCGLLIGVACVLPGVSGGVMAAGFGLYLPMLDALVRLFTEPRKSLSLLFPLGTGIAFGIFLGAVALAEALSRWYTPCVLLFIGLVLGGIPSFVREANRGGFRGSYAAALLLGAAAACGLLLLPETAQNPVLLWWQALLTGGVAAVGTLIPGVSMTCILLLLGWYTPFVRAIAEPAPVTLLFLTAGALLTGVPLIGLVRRLFLRHFGAASYAVLGFLVVTVGMSFPFPLSGAEEQAALLLLPVGLMTAMLLARATGTRALR